MNISKKTILVSTGAFIFVLALWLGLSFYSVGRVASAINQMVSQPDPKSSIRFKNLQHQTGFLSAKGDVWVSLADKFSEDGLSDTQPVWLQVQYDVSHLILPTSLARFEWRLQPLPEDKAKFEEIFPKDFALTGQGAVGLGGSYRSTLKLPAFEIAQSEVLLNVAATEGFFKLSDNQFQFDWATNKLNYRGAGQALQVDLLNISMDISNTQKGLGTSSISMQKLSTSSATVEGLKIAAESTISQEKLDVRLTQSLERATFMNQTLSNVQAEWIVAGLHEQSSEKLIQLMDLSQGFKNMTAEEDKSMREAVNVLLLKGGKVGLSKLTAQSGSGSLQGQLMLELEPATGEKILLDKSLKLNGEIKTTGQLLTADQEEMFVKWGVAVKTADGLQATVNMTQGKLKFNGKENEATDLRAELSKEQGLLDAFLSGSAQINKDPLQLLPELAEVEEPIEPAPAPAPTVKEQD